MEQEEQTCRECNTKTTDWWEDGSRLVDGEEEQAYVCKTCREKRIYITGTIEVKPSKNIVKYDD